MVRRHTTAFRAALMAVDFATAVAIFVLISIARYGAEWQVAWHRLGGNPWLAAASFGAGWVVLVWFGGLYRVRARWSLRSEIIGLLRATAVLLLATITILFVVKVSDASRLLIGVLFIALAVTAILSRIVLRAVFAWFRRRGYMTRNLLVLGANQAGQDFADRIERHSGLGLDVIGHLAASDGVMFGLTRPVLGRIDDVQAVLHREVVDEVAVCLPVGEWDLVEPVTRLCAGEGKVVRIPGEGIGPGIAGGYSEEFDGTTVVSLAYGPDRAVGLMVKRLADLLMAGLALILLSPIFGLIALRIRSADGSPVIFRQTRVGLNGRRFELLKFRTMQADAEERLAEIEELNEISGRAFKVTNDPRLTRSGSFLRRSGLDELPQLWNVVRGEMSLVGPRPPLPSEVDGYDVWHRRRLSMKPGITGLWQVSARREPDFDRWVRLDLEYIDRWSLLLDFKILLRTIPAVVNQEGR
jgi:exopolysaccharide biosynthesis polyprenyl glycosylphosphotransferase